MQMRMLNEMEGCSPEKKVRYNTEGRPWNIWLYTMLHPGLCHSVYAICFFVYAFCIYIYNCLLFRFATLFFNFSYCTRKLVGPGRENVCHFTWTLSMNVVNLKNRCRAHGQDMISLTLELNFSLFLLRIASVCFPTKNQDCISPSWYHRPTNNLRWPAIECVQVLCTFSAVEFVLFWLSLFLCMSFEVWAACTDLW